MLFNYLLDCLESMYAVLFMNNLAVLYNLSLYDYVYYIQRLYMPDHYHCHTLQDSLCMYGYNCLIGLNKIMR